MPCDSAYSTYREDRKTVVELRSLALPTSGSVTILGCAAMVSATVPLDAARTQYACQNNTVHARSGFCGNTARDPHTRC